MIAALMGTGVFLAVRLKNMPLNNFFKAVSLVFKKGEKKGGISPFQSLMTALAATVGTGNIAGVATALTLGGTGALFWMWVSCVIGLTTKYAECFLSVKYKKGHSGGPMYAMRYGMGGRKGRTLAVLFSVFGTAASFGIGCAVQSNTMAQSAQQLFSFSPAATGIITAACVFVTLAFGIKGIGRLCGALVPFMAALYIGCGTAVIISNHEEILPSLKSIFESALSIPAAAGGAAGMAIRFGCERGIFSNESGLGSAGIAAAAADTKPHEAGLINMAGAFFDTIIICTVTGLAITTSGAMQTGKTGIALTAEAFSRTFGEAGVYIVSLSLILLAFSTIIGWEYYGEKCFDYIGGSRRPYRVIYTAFVFFGCIAPMTQVWQLSSCANALMAAPNIICLIVLSKKLPSRPPF